MNDIHRPFQTPVLHSVKNLRGSLGVDHPQALLHGPGHPNVVVQNTRVVVPVVAHFVRAPIQVLAHLENNGTRMCIGK
jgi:hypothetical protein